MPWLLPIQFSCISRTLSGQWSSVGEPVEQLLGEIGDLEEPLAELAPLDQRARAPAAAVDHLLVGEHGHVDRVPIDLALLAIDQARLVKVEEQRLLVAVISGLAGGELAAPVEREAEPLQLRRASSRYWPRSIRRDGRCAPSPHFRPACRTRPSPSGGALRSPSSAGSGRARPPSCSCGHGPCGCAPTDRGTSPGRRPWAGRCRPTARKVPASSQTFCQCASAFSGLKRDAIARSFLDRGNLSGDGGAAQVAGAGEDDLLEPLHGRRRHRRVDPLAVLQRLARGGDAQRVGAQVAGRGW